MNDKWDEKEPEKGHKLVDYASRCVIVPDDTAASKSQKSAQVSTSTCLTGVGRAAEPAPIPQGRRHQGQFRWEEGSHLKEYTYKITGGTGKFKGASGGGTYMYEELDGHSLGG